jgi:hypothetical protein
MPFDPHSHPPDLALHGSRATVMTKGGRKPWRTEKPSSQTHAATKTPEIEIHA